MRELSAKLRRLRRDQGVTQHAVARAINVSKSLIAAFESGRLIPQLDAAERLDAYFGTENTLRMMVADAHTAREQERERHQRHAPIYESWPAIESSAWLLRNYQPLLVPGLLQTEAYARAVLISTMAFSSAEIQEHVTARMARQELLGRERPPQMLSVIDQAVLRRVAGGPPVMREQCEKLLRWGELPTITVQVVPEDAGLYVGTGGPVALATTDHGTYGFLDDQAGGRTIDDRGAVCSLVRRWETIRGYALSERQSLALISRMMEEWS